MCERSHSKLENISRNNLNYHDQLSDAGECSSERHIGDGRRRQCAMFSVLGAWATRCWGNLRVCTACWPPIQQVHHIIRAASGRGLKSIMQMAQWANADHGTNAIQERPAHTRPHTVWMELKNLINFTHTHTACKLNRQRAIKHCDKFRVNYPFATRWNC